MNRLPFSHYFDALCCGASAGVVTGLVWQNDYLLRLSSWMCAALVIVKFVEALLICRNLKRMDRDLDERFANLDRVAALSGQQLFEEYERYLAANGFLGLRTIGDTRCVHKARSSYLRCAINPSGPCKDCPDFTSESPAQSQEADSSIAESLESHRETER